MYPLVPGFRIPVCSPGYACCVIVHEPPPLGKLVMCRGPQAGGEPRNTHRGQCQSLEEEVVYTIYL